MKYWWCLLNVKNYYFHENLLTILQYKQTWKVKKPRIHQLSVTKMNKGLKNMKYSKINRKILEGYLSREIAFLYFIFLNFFLLLNGIYFWNFIYVLYLIHALQNKRGRKDMQFLKNSCLSCKRNFATSRKPSKYNIARHAWWCRPLLPELWRLRQVDLLSLSHSWTT